MFSKQELATILGALRHYQRDGLADHPEQRPDWLQDIVCPTENSTSLDSTGIDMLCQELNLPPSDGVHRVVLSNGEVVRLEEGTDRLHISTELHGFEDMYICTINADGVLVMPNSGGATADLTAGLQAGGESQPLVEPVLDYLGELRSAREVPKQQRALCPELFQAMGMTVKQLQSEAGSDEACWEFYIRSNDGAEAFLHRLYFRSTTGLMRLPIQDAEMEILEVGCQEPPLDFEGSQLGTVDWLQRHGLYAPIEAYPSFDETADLTPGEVFGMAESACLDEYLPNSKTRAKWTALECKKIGAWLAAEIYLVNDIDLPRVPTPLTVIAGAQQRGKELPPRYAKHVERAEWSPPTTKAAEEE